jgi:hypothetical protein
MSIVRAYSYNITTNDIEPGAVTEPKIDLSTPDSTNLVLATTGTAVNKPPEITFDRKSTTVADDMDIGKLSFRGQNAAPEEIEYVSIAAVSSDVVDGDEGGQLTFSCMAGGTAGTAAMKKFMAMGLEDAGTFPALVQVNPVNEDIDFQVRSTTGNNLFRCDSAAHLVGISNSADGSIGAVFQVVTTASSSIPAPRMTTTQRNALSNITNGCMIYNVTTNKLQCHNGSGWQDCF